jgi:hypothetical protein
MSYRKKFLIPILAIASAVSISLAAMEVLLRVAGFKSPVLHPEMFVVNEKDPLLPYSLRPGYSGVYGGGTVNVNSIGNRVVPWPQDIAESKLSNQIIILGDSIAFGQSLDDGDTIAANLQKQLLQSGQLNRVILIAAPGYTSWNEYMALSRYSNLSNVNTVVIFYARNDMTKDNDYFKFNETGGKIFFMDRDIIRRSLRIMYDHSRLIFLLSDSIKKIIYSMKEETKATVETLDSGALSYSIEAIKQLSEFCRARDINLIVAIYRDALFYDRPAWFGNYERYLSSSLSSISVDHFVLQWATKSLSKRQFGVSWNDGFHPSKEASQTIAAELAAELAKRGF